MKWHFDFWSFWVGAVLAFCWVIGMYLFITTVRGIGRRK